MVAQARGMQQHAVLAYFLLALGISWAGWIPYGAAQAGLLSYRVPAEVPMLSQFGPFLAALLLMYSKNGPAGSRRLLGSLLHCHVGPQWYGFVLLITPSVALVIAAVHIVLGGSGPHFHDLGNWFQRYSESVRTGGWNVMKKEALPSLGFISFLADVAARGPLPALFVFVLLGVASGPLSEEPGWRGYALPRLEAKYSALRASLIVAVLWGLWHTGPDFWTLLLKGQVIALVFPLATILGSIPLAILFTWVYNNTEGSLLLAVLFHASLNSTYSFMNLVWPEIPFQQRYLEFTVVFSLVAVAVVVVYGAARLSRKQVVALSED